MEKTARLPREQVVHLSLRPQFIPLLPVERSWARKEGERLLEEARKEAARLLEKARAEVNELHARAERECAEQVTRETARSLARVLKWRERQAAGMRRQVLALGRLLAERIIQEELRLHPEQVRSLCRGVLEENLSDQEALVLVHPQHLQQLAALALGRWDGKVRFQASAELERGDCLVRGGFGEVDARLKVRLEVLLKFLERSLPHGAGTDAAR